MSPSARRWNTTKSIVESRLLYPLVFSQPAFSRPVSPRHRHRSTRLRSLSINQPRLSRAPQGTRRNTPTRHRDSRNSKRRDTCNSKPTHNRDIRKKPHPSLVTTRRRRPHILRHQPLNLSMGRPLA
jgi:hypothetical protein